MSDKNLIAFIFARGGSKGIPGKNIQIAGGKPLLAHAIASGLSSSKVEKVVVSTDSDKIAAVAREFGAEVLTREASLATDSAPELLSWQHAVRAFQSYFDSGGLFINIPATSPLRSAVDIDAAIDRYQRGDCDIVFGISPSHRNPYLNMVSIDEHDLIKVVNDDNQATRRQDVPVVYDITTCVYVSGPQYVMSTTRPIDGRVGYVIVPPERALDIDTPYDLHLADLILRNPFSPST